MQIYGYDFTQRMQGTLERHRTMNVAASRPPGEQPAFVRVVLECTNGAVVTKDFTTAREAMVFLEGHGRV